MLLAQSGNNFRISNNHKTKYYNRPYLCKIIFIMKALNLCRLSCYVATALFVTADTACKKTIVSDSKQASGVVQNDDLLAGREKSGLFLSAADTAAAVNNLYLYKIAATQIQEQMQYTTNAKDGNGVYYNQATDEVYQLGRKNKTLYVFANASTMSGTPTASRTFTDTTLSSGREITYDVKRDILYASNNTDSSIRVYKGFTNLSGNVKGEVLKISGQPWGITYDRKENRLVVVMDQAAMRLDIFDSPDKLIAGTVTASRSINITNRPNGTYSRLHGVDYNYDIDALVVTEIGEATAPLVPTEGKPAFNADGGIYVLKNAASKLASGGTFAADTEIYGANTGLGNPVDVSARWANGKAYIFVAEKANKKLMIFDLTISGDASPGRFIATTFSPEAITVTK